MDQKKKEATRKRQSKYRKAQREAGVEGRRQIGPFVKTVTYWNLKRLAKNQGISQGELLDILIEHESRRERQIHLMDNSTI